MKLHYANNLHEIEPGLRLYSDQNCNGIEVPCRVTTWGRQGAIDILAIDQQDRLVVIECKHKYADAMAFGQVLGYLCWIQHWLRSESKHTNPSDTEQIRTNPNHPEPPRTNPNHSEPPRTNPNKPEQSHPTFPLPGAIVRDGFRLGALEPQPNVRAYIVAKRANPILKLLLDSFPSFPVTVFEYERALDL